MHKPQMCGYIIETCAALHNCARICKIKLLRDFPAKDGFRKIQKRAVQPLNTTRAPRVKFANIRADYIEDFFQ